MQPTPLQHKEDPVLYLQIQLTQFGLHTLLDIGTGSSDRFAAGLPVQQSATETEGSQHGQESLVERRTACTGISCPQAGSRTVYEGSAPTLVICRTGGKKALRSKSQQICSEGFIFLNVKTRMAMSIGCLISKNCRTLLQLGEYSFHN